jgi:hypothetical protein
MRAFLEGSHDQWLQEVRRVLDPATDEAAGIWLRWRALEYLETGFSRRFVRERRAVLSLHGRFTDAQASHLWAAGELMARLLESLHHRVGLCQRGEEFTALALTLITALEHWWRQVEEVLGPVAWEEVSPESRGLFEIINFDEADHGT